MSCPGRINLNMVLDRETAEARGEPTHFPCACERVAPKRDASNLAAIRDTTIEAVLRAALAQSVKLDGLIEGLWEARAGRDDRPSIGRLCAWWSNAPYCVS